MGTQKIHYFVNWRNEIKMNEHYRQREKTGLDHDDDGRDFPDAYLDFEESEVFYTKEEAFAKYNSIVETTDTSITLPAIVEYDPRFNISEDITPNQ